MRSTWNPAGRRGYKFEGRGARWKLVREKEILVRESDEVDEEEEDDEEDVPCDKYNGVMPVEAFLVHFRAISGINGWGEKENLAQLIVALEGPAAQVMLETRE